jgi:hypothetical protein
VEATSTKLYNLANYSIIAIPLRRQNELFKKRSFERSSEYCFVWMWCIPSGFCVTSQASKTSWTIRGVHWLWLRLSWEGKLKISITFTRRVIYFVFHFIADFSDLLELRNITQINDLFLSSCVPRKLLMSLMDAIFLY